MENITRALLVMDGNYVRKCFAHLADDGIDGNFYSINFTQLLKHISSLIEKDFGSRCVFAAKKLYMGTNAEFDAQNQDFYHALDEGGIQKITFPLQASFYESGRAGMKEEACDTTIVFNTAKEFYSVSKENRFDTLVLFAGDGDLTPLVSGLQAEGVKVVVIYYDFASPFSKTRASQKLLETADKVIDFESFLRERVDKEIISIFTRIEGKSSGNHLSSINNLPGYESSAPRRKVVVVKEKSQFAPFSSNFSTNLSSSGKPYTREEIANAINGIAKKDDEGYVLVAQLGKYLEYETGRTLPFGTKLKDLLNLYKPFFETKELPAYSVRIAGKAEKRHEL